MSKFKIIDFLNGDARSYQTLYEVAEELLKQKIENGNAIFSRAVYYKDIPILSLGSESLVPSCDSLIQLGERKIAEIEREKALEKKETAKELIFDMDGTIADLYGVFNWLPMLREEDCTPYLEACPLYDMESLKQILLVLKDKGYIIKVVTWGSLDSSEAFLKDTAEAKKAWLEEYQFPYDTFDCIPYGTEKADFSDTRNLSILVDDNQQVRNSFMKAEIDAIEKRVIDASKNIMEALINLIVEESEK